MALGLSAVLVGIDQIIKLWVLENLVPVRQMTVVQNFFYLTYVENRGAAFGLFQTKTILLAVLTSVVLLGIIYLILSGRITEKLMVWSLALVVAGGVGNLIDRVARGFVVDYLDFGVLFGFPVFNFADCCVVVGTILLLGGILWQDRQQSKQKAG